MEQALILCVSFQSKLEAQAISTELLQRGLIHSAKILASSENIEMRNGSIEIQHEFIGLLNSKAAHKTRLLKTIKECHSNKDPWIIELKSTKPSLDFLVLAKADETKTVDEISDNSDDSPPWDE